MKTSKKVRQIQKKYRENHKEARNRSSRLWAKENKEKRKANRLKHLNKVKARNQARQIKIPEGQICVKCHKILATEKHHEDYNKPLEVDFVCKECHQILDNLKQERENV
jgi:RNase P subunit RPR2